MPVQHVSPLNKKMKAAILMSPLNKKMKAAILMSPLNKKMKVAILMSPLNKKMKVGRSSQILKSKQCNPLICDIKEGHKASTQTKFH